MRGPLSLIKEVWTDEGEASQGLAEYVVSMRDRMSCMTELVTENLANAQRQQKHWYDRNARDREFKPEEQVLILLPAETNKLQAVWQGPYKVTRKVSPVDYEVDTGKKRKKLRIFHVNLLRKWHVAEATCYMLDK